VWQWQNSGNAVDPARWRETPVGHQGEFLALSGSSWRAVSDYKSGVFLCQWSEDEYAVRTRRLADLTGELPGVIHRFTYGNRHYLLINSSMLWYGAARFCELLGGRLASLDTSEVREFVIRQTAAFPEERILLGGYAKREKWYWLSGGEITFALQADEFNPIPSCNRNFVTLQNGKFCNSQFSSSFLCELSISSDSSR